MTMMTLLVRLGECLILAARCFLNTLFMVLMPPMPWTEARQRELNLWATQMSKLNSKITAKKYPDAYFFQHLPTSPQG